MNRAVFAVYLTLFSMALYGHNMSISWVSYYKGPGSNEGYPVDLVTDDSGYVYLTGVSEGEPLRPHESGSIYRDIATVKYTSEGKQIWAVRYNGPDNNSIDEPSNIAVSIDGGVVVSGISSYSNDKLAKGVILKYSPEGELVWKQISDSDRYNGVCFDVNGNLYVVKTSIVSKNNTKIGVARLDNSGCEIWSSQKKIVAKAISSLLLDNTNACLYLCEGEKRTTKYTFDGQEVWEMPYTSMQIQSRNMYSIQRKEASSFALSQYNMDSKEKWNFVFQTEGAIRDISIESGNNDDLYLCGTSEQNNVMKIVLSKYANGGKQAWTKYCEGNTYNLDFKVRGEKIYILGSTRIDVANYTMGSNSLLLIFNKDGELIDNLKSEKFGSPRKLFTDKKYLYVIGNGGSDRGEYLVAKLCQSTEAGVSDDRKDFSAKDTRHIKNNITTPPMNGNPKTISESLAHEQKAYAKRMYEYLKTVYKELGPVKIADEDITIPEMMYESDIYIKWGLGAKREFSLEEKYYIMNLNQVDETWQLYSSIDLKNLNTPEKEFLERMRKQYGEGSVNLRQKAMDEGKQLVSNQQLFFDLIKAVTGDDTLDDRGLIFSYRVTPK